MFLMLLIHIMIIINTIIIEMANTMTTCNVHTKLLLCYILKTQIKSKYLASQPDEHVWRHCLPVLCKLHYAKVPRNQAHQLAYIVH